MQIESPGASSSIFRRRNHQRPIQRKLLAFASLPINPAGMACGFDPASAGERGIEPASNPTPPRRLD
uniref:hypothetical protein n=1 Tax=Sulfuriferula sp. GW6 TaxID=3345112 RepID=UPI0039F66265